MTVLPPPLHKFFFLHVITDCREVNNTRWERPTKMTFIPPVKSVNWFKSQMEQKAHKFHKDHFVSGRKK
jgi:hypothetical protein